MNAMKMKTLTAMVTHFAAILLDRMNADVDLAIEETV